MNEEKTEITKKIKDVINKTQHKLQSKTRNKLDLKTLIGIILLLAGISLASFPYLMNMYYQHVQERQLEDAMEQVQNKENKKEQTGPKGPSLVYDNYDRVNDENEKEYPEELKPDEGVLEIAPIDVQLKIGYGVDLPALESGPGFYPESGYPDNGNVSIAGHRTTYGAPFRNLDQLEKGDPIKLIYRGKEYIYKVDDVFDTHKYDWSVIDPTDDPALTLTTCHPPGSAEQRLVVRAYLDEKNSKD